MDTIVYLSYGTGPHVDEIAYSVLSALTFRSVAKSGYRIIVYADGSAGYLGDLPVHIEPITDSVLAEWAGPLDFIHRRKIFVIKHALMKFGGRVLYCDSDTFFTKHPRKAFDRIGPRRSLMHIAEYHLGDPCTQRLASFVDSASLDDREERRWNIPASTVMFNAGVIGLHENDTSLLDEVVHLTDAIYPHVSIPTVEQFAFSVCLQQRTRLQQSHDIVHHYWPIERRARFREELGRLLHDASIDSQAERMRRLSLVRPSRVIRDRPFKGPVPRGFRARVHAALWKTANRTGVLVPLKKVAARTGLYRSTPSV